MIRQPSAIHPSFKKETNSKVNFIIPCVYSDSNSDALGNKKRLREINSTYELQPEVLSKLIINTYISSKVQKKKP